MRLLDRVGLLRKRPDPATGRLDLAAGPEEPPG
jgi:hypothetical protein